MYASCCVVQRLNIKDLAGTNREPEWIISVARLQFAHLIQALAESQYCRRHQNNGEAN